MSLFLIMNTKDKIIHALEGSKGEYVSGESLADDLGVSRNAVWKAVRDLKEEGYPIDSVRNRGYMLSGSSDIISKAGIGLSLGGMMPPRLTSELLDRLYVYDDLDSTNTQAKRELLLDGFGILHGTTIVAKVQSSGRGHRGSDFDSPAGGIYLSVILDPAMLHTRKLGAGAVADTVISVLEELYGVKVSKKKDNSLCIGRDKICGILTEAVSDLETGVYSSFIVGIGIRADELLAVSDGSPSKNQVIAALMAEFSKL